MSRKIEIPELAVVVMIGASGSGKSTFARQHFEASEIVSSDYCRLVISDDENDQSVTADAFDLVDTIASKRLKNRRLVVIDATNVRPDDRKSYVRLAREFHALPVAIVLNLPERVCRERNQSRPDRDFGGHVIHRQASDLKRLSSDVQCSALKRHPVFRTTAGESRAFGASRREAVGRPERWPKRWPRGGAGSRRCPESPQDRGRGRGEG